MITREVRKLDNYNDEVKKTHRQMLKNYIKIFKIPPTESEVKIYSEKFKDDVDYLVYGDRETIYKVGCYFLLRDKWLDYRHMSVGEIVSGYFGADCDTFSDIYDELLIITYFKSDRLTKLNEEYPLDIIGKRVLLDKRNLFLSEYQLLQVEESKLLKVVNLSGNVELKKVPYKKEKPPYTNQESVPSPVPQENKPRETRGGRGVW